MQAEGAMEDGDLHVRKGIGSSCDINANSQSRWARKSPHHHGHALNLKRILKLLGVC